MPRAEVDTARINRKPVPPIHSVWSIILTVSFVLGKLIKAYLPKEFFFCPSRVIFGIPCPACGSGGATKALLDFKFIEAFKYNPFFLLGLFALFVWSAMVAISYSIGKPLEKWGIDKKRKSIQRYGLIFFILASWIYQIIRATGIFNV